jgi:hypothetical protein
MPSSGVRVELQSTVTPEDGIIHRNIYVMSITLVFYFLIPPTDPGTNYYIFVELYKWEIFMLITICVYSHKRFLKE